ncbi:hypothetical protein ACUOA8_62920, partial [Escherichia sp. SS-MK2]
LSLNLPARANLSPQAQAVKELLMSKRDSWKAW